VLSSWQGGTVAVFVTLLTCALVIVDVADSAARRWWDGHSITTDTVSGLLPSAVSPSYLAALLVLRLAPALAADRCAGGHTTQKTRLEEHVAG
jgi:hypothetical protein